MSNGVFKVYLGDKLYYLIMDFIVRYEHADFGCYLETRSGEIGFG